MSNRDFIFLIFAIIFLSFAMDNVGGTPSPLPQKTNVFELMSNEGDIAMYLNTLNLDKELEPIVPVELCTCNGTGKVRTPDGLDTITCQCGTNCKCAKTEQERKKCPRCGKEDCPGAYALSFEHDIFGNTLAVMPPGFNMESIKLPEMIGDNVKVTLSLPLHSSVNLAESTFIDETLDKQVLFFTGVNCPPCQVFKSKDIPELKSLKWDVSEDRKAHIRIVDVDKHRDYYDRYKGFNEGIPMFVLLEKGQVKKILVGYHTAKQITDMWYGTN